MNSAQKKNKKKVYIGIIGGIAIMLMFMMPICYVQSIEVTNNRYYSEDEIIKVSGIEKKHLLDLAYLSSQDRLLELPYIANAELSYKFPGKIVIDLVEKAPYVYVKFKGNYLCLNEQGQVIEQSQEKYHEIPVVDGLKFEKFTLEETLPILNEEHWFVAQEVMTELIKCEYVDKIKEIDVHNIEEIHLYVDKLDVIMGDIGDFDKKIEVLIQAYEVKGFAMGELDISRFIKTGNATLRQIT
ncbi:MAG: FtsQ-type POTRA domain-containing protein [Cellulosilyticum sp.]|nr:FtsQ-type POTRA domain-containing protein [Cellulosilyticum sp.]